MLFKTTIYSVPTRMLPFKLQDHRAGTINTSSAPLSIIRSPHIDKKSWEQFKFFMQKKTQILRNPRRLPTTVQFAKSLYKMIAPIRIKITICYFYKFGSKF